MKTLSILIIASYITITVWMIHRVIYKKKSFLAEELYGSNKLDPIITVACAILTLLLLVADIFFVTAGYQTVFKTEEIVGQVIGNRSWLILIGLALVFKSILVIVNQKYFKTIKK
ncbi:hypothetical protein KC866_02465 [Patescibacteria group bacterium]|nr:hypothetical protein [Patescibacteria group bacterium]